MRRSSYALIRLEHLKHNLNLLRSLVPNTKIISVVKADAYGHGLAKTAQALAQSDAFAVTCAQEALELRSTGILHPIICLQGFHDANELQMIVDANIQAVIHSEYQIKILQAHPLKQSIQVWLKVDTGMRRLGFYPDEIDKHYQSLANVNQVSKIRLMTHFANADLLDDTSIEKQLKLFEDCSQKLTDCEKSAANSAASLAYSKASYDWIRPGLSLYGISPFQADKSHPDFSEFKPVMSLRSPLISIKQCYKGDKIGYGGTYTCPSDMRVGVVAIGYADGFPRTIEPSLHVSVNSVLAPIVGRVSMDMLTIDLSNIDAEIGDDVELWGDDIPVNEVAHAANTISYELLCRVTGNVNRIYE